ncbi:hypothetical protein GDO78_018177 [Eleutherodactylus coqui]|uniref:Uncharacterized protein n=1 Tax=Eleutherodactylus coqui TaxID=57060 RepID=A0A8J6E9R8_ELECQ|nr:hypothetical protein GDO78_018177 [Eleutherodactylus coqui]
MVADIPAAHCIRAVGIRVITKRRHGKQRCTACHRLCSTLRSCMQGHGRGHSWNPLQTDSTYGHVNPPKTRHKSSTTRYVAPQWRH